MTKLLAALENSGPAQLIANSLWGFPILEITHLCGLTLVFAGMVVIDTRLIGVRKDISAQLVLRVVLPFVWAGFAISAFSGAWLFAFEARTLIGDGPFLLKMALLAVAGANALFMHKVGMQDVYAWDTGATPPAVVRISAATSLLMWLTILACGRLIERSCSSCAGPASPWLPR